MPTLSIYVNDKIYGHLLAKGKPSTIGKEWIEERYETEVSNAR